MTVIILAYTGIYKILVEICIINGAVAWWLGHSFQNYKVALKNCISLSSFELTVYLKYILSHEKKSLKKSILSLKIFLIENECETSYGCLTFIFYQKYFLWSNGLKEGFFIFIGQYTSSLH